MAQTIKLSETYDLKTTVNKLGLVGVHTPQMTQLYNLYPGFVKNHKFMRVLKCDVVGACASVLPADPQQVGVEDGQIAPEDMFNPILYTAVSNDSFDTLMAQIYNAYNSEVNPDGSVVVTEKGPTDLSQDPFQIYYGLLADSKKFKKAMPQRGFAMKNLRPLCYQLLSSYGNVGSSLSPNDIVSGNSVFLGQNAVGTGNVGGVSWNLAETFKGRSMRLPKLPLHYIAENIESSGTLAEIPKTFVMAIIVPPAKLHSFYYRMRVTWTIRFEEPCSTIQTAKFAGMASIGALSYGSSYIQPSASKSELPNTADSVDTLDVDINKIMES